MARKKKNIYVEVWEWLLEKGIFGSMVLLFIIYVVVLGATMFILRWILNR